MLQVLASSSQARKRRSWMESACPDPEDKCPRGAEPLLAGGLACKASSDSLQVFGPICDSLRDNRLA